MNQAAVVPPRTVKIKPLMTGKCHCNRPGKQLICSKKSNSVSGKTPNFKHRKQASISDLLGVHLEMDGLSDTSTFSIFSQQFAKRMNIVSPFSFLFFNVCIFYIHISLFNILFSFFVCS